MAQLPVTPTNTQKRIVQIDDTRYVFTGADPLGVVDAKIKRALATGGTVTEDGISNWIEDLPLIDYTKPGLVPITRGQKAKCERVHFTKMPDGRVTRNSLGFVWCKATSVLGSGE